MLEACHTREEITKTVYGDAIKHAKKENWEEWIVNTETMMMWVLNKFITVEPTDRGRTRIPNLKVKQPDGSTKEVTTNEEKSKAFFDVFFAPPPDQSHVPDYVYEKPKEQFKHITNEQIH